MDGRPGGVAGAGAGAPREPALRRVVQVALRGYMRLWHRLRVEGRERLPATGPALVLTNHASVLDALALAAANPYPGATAAIKAEMFAHPVLGPIFTAWEAIPVARDGQDTAALRALLRALRRGRVVGMAAEGRRSRDGRLGAVHPVLARLAVRAAVPVVPLGIGGTFAAMPPGALWPRPRPIRIEVGPALRFPPETGGDEAAVRIREAIAALLPPHQRPLPGPRPATDRDQ